jgi:hypothetical protein
VEGAGEAIRRVGKLRGVVHSVKVECGKSPLEILGKANVEKEKPGEDPPVNQAIDPEEKAEELGHGAMCRQSAVRHPPGKETV